MKDHEIAQVVNQLTAIGKTYGHTQQLRDRIAAVVVPLLKPKEEPKTMLIAPFCIGKKCSCQPGNCAEVGMRPDTAVTVYIHDHSPAKPAREAVAEIRAQRSEFIANMNEKLRASREHDRKALLSLIDDETQICYTEKK